MFDQIAIQFKTNWVAIIGAITGVTGLILSLLNYYRDRARIKIFFKTGWKFIGAVTPYKNNTPYDCITVINKGRRPVKIQTASARIKNTDKGNHIIISDSWAVFKNKLLNEENPKVEFFYESSLKKHNDIYCINVSDEAGRNYRKWLHRWRYIWDKMTRKA
jgi:hypothetical protein